MNSYLRNIYLFTKYFKYLHATSGSITFKAFDPLALQKTTEIIQELDRIHINLLKSIKNFIHYYISQQYSFLSKEVHKSSLNIYYYMLRDCQLLDGHYNFVNISIPTHNSLSIIKLFHMNYVLEMICNTYTTNTTFAKLPVKIRKYTVLRSPHVDKKAREQFELRKFKHVSNLSYLKTLHIHSFLNMQLPSGIGYLVNLSHKRF